MASISFAVLLVLYYVTESTAQIVEGLVPSVFTPFDDHGHLNLSAIPEYAKYLSCGVDGVLVAGTASEGPSLSLEERKALLDAWAEVAKPNGLQIVMQVGGLPLPEVLELARYSETRADAILTLPELYYKPANEERLVQFVKMVSVAAPSLPIMYYDHPSMSGVKLNMAKFFGLATKSISQFKGIKCGFQTAVDISTHNSVNDDQRMFMVSHATMASAYMLGYNGSMSTISNLFPRRFRDIQRAVQHGDFEKARLMQRELNERVAIITEIGGYVQCAKAATEIISGIKLGTTREPLQRITIEQRRLVEEKVTRLKDHRQEC